ncbi:DNA (cytosine-5-)-methyltransferase [Bacillus safensis]|uniref:DNA (cytosine-5-)-methyltransferase n=1 Tax=Bacillus safensis TaxID=561879 RepID=UPI0021E61A14|nr:DNA (cytosine-5-)-methyltransferase [Bacillus safensis]UXO88831.1 DNA (cytosine-5-)-methyltransferase [Bacillus safensis]
MNKFKVMSLFSGIGAFEVALRNIGADFEMVGFSEIDKYAIKSYCAIHNVDESLNYGDVSKIDKSKLPDFDILVGGSPCQSFSLAGHRKGFEDARGTLFFQYVETLKEKQPKYFIFENVKGLINHDKGNTLNIMTSAFSEVGYRIDMELLNSKYFKVPQNRERIFIVGIREDIIENDQWFINNTRNDVLSKGKKRLKELKIKSFNFKWYEQDYTGSTLRDILEECVDEKYYLSEEKTDKLVRELEDIEEVQVLRPERNEYGKAIRKKYESGCIRESRHNMTQLRPREDSISNTLSTVQKDNLLLEPQIGHVDLKGHDAIKRVYSPDGISPTLTTMGGGHRESKIAVQQLGNVNPSGKGMNGQVYNSTGLSPTLTTIKGEGVKVAVEVRPVLTPDREKKRQNGRRFKEDGEASFTVNTIDKHDVAIGNYPRYRIRKLTPLECWRLQAFDDEDFEKAVVAGISNSQLYKQAGNSITVTVLEEIFKELLNTYK